MFNIHRCSDYCLTSKKGKERQCRMEFGTGSSPGKQLKETTVIVKDKNGSLRFEMAREQQMLVQHSRFHSQGWRANGDISLIVSKSDADNPSVDDILATEKYRNEKDTSSFYDFICKNGKVPVLTGCNIQASWPLDENDCRTMLHLHTPNWRQLLDVTNDNLSWVHEIESVLQTDVCPKFVKADTEKARKHISVDNQEDDIPISSEQCEQPERMELVQPNPLYEDTYTDFKYDNGGPEHTIIRLIWVFLGFKT
ncbi:unnamed protein product [Mytilus coruscus]|uniref:Uncharacterized protein n=1 Tax=Mytilus coruscus TaxID=42192 RepID=A0A6J8BYL9_MYTCO|nr:unnamed protein product [Mytilus coruscus]